MRTVILAAAAILLATPALAAPKSSDGWTPYFGLDYQDMNLGKGPMGQSLPSSLSGGVDAHVGLRIGRHLGVELGYQAATTERDNTNAAGATYLSKLSVYGPTLDVMGYLPLAGDQLSAIGTVGLAFASGKGTNTDPTAGVAFSQRGNDTDVRAGLGLEWRPVRTFSVDLIGRYQTASFSVPTNANPKVTQDLSKGGLVATLGVNFYF